MVINKVNLNSIGNKFKPMNGNTDTINISCYKMNSNVSKIKSNVSKMKFQEIKFNSHIVFENIVNLHAVGALTAGGGKVAHTFRPWEVQSIDSIDLMDSCLGSVRYQVRGGEIMRVLPRVNDKINGEWATDKGRYAALDGVKSQEVGETMIKDSKNSSWESVNIKTAFEEIKQIKGKVRVVYGGTTDCESINEITKWCKNNNVSLQTVSPVNNSKVNVNRYDSTSDNESFVPSGDNFNNGLLVGCDPRMQSPLLNVQLRERYLEGTEYYRIGGSLDLTYPVRHVGLGIKSLERFKSENKKVDFALVGADLYRRNDIGDVMKNVSNVTDNKVRICTTRANETFIITHNESKMLNETDSYEAQLLVNITSMEVDAAGYNINEIISKAKTNIVITAKGSDWMKQANIIIPVLNCLETESKYVSMLGGVRNSKIIISRGKELNSIQELFNKLPSIKESTITEEISNLNKESINSKDCKSNVPFVNSMVDYHLEGHTFAESSSTMGRCSSVFMSYQTNFK